MGRALPVLQPYAERDLVEARPRAGAPDARTRPAVPFSELPELSALKVLDHIDRLQAVLRGERPAPVTLEVDLTNACNHRCTWCIEAEYISTSRNTLPIAVVRRVLDEAAAMGVRSVVFKGGGEPLLHPQLDVAVEHAKSVGLEVGLITNGERLIEHVDVLARTLSWVRVSLDAGTEATHVRLHGARPGAFRRALEGLRALSASVFGGAHFVVAPGNVGDIRAAAVAARDHGARYVAFRPVTSDTLVMTAAERAAAIASVESARRDLSTETFRVLGEGAWRSERAPYGLCKGHALVAILGATGELYACCSTRGNASYSFGSVHDASFADLWTGKQRSDVLDKIDAHDCRSLCRSRSLFRYDRYNEVAEYLAGSSPHRNFL